MEKISVTVTKRENRDDQFYWNLFMQYLMEYDKPNFSIPFFEKTNGMVVANSMQVDLTKEFASIQEKLFQLESKENFIGFQIPDPDESTNG